MKTNIIKTALILVIGVAMTGCEKLDEVPVNIPITISSVMLAPGDQSEGTISLHSYDIFSDDGEGLPFYYDAELYGHLTYQNDNKWTPWSWSGGSREVMHIPYIGESRRIYAYFPAFGVSELNWGDKTFYVGNDYRNVDMLYGKSNLITASNRDAQITMHHVFAKIVFNVSSEVTSNFSYEISHSIQPSGDNYFPTEGTFNMETGEFTRTNLDEHPEAIYAFDTLTSYMIPCEANELKLVITESDRFWGTDIIQEGVFSNIVWKSGYVYTYNVTGTGDGTITISEPTVTPWDTFGNN